jgi:4-amino-4-deoxy-L-arabinose transferase-like glycosyltransferase
MTDARAGVRLRFRPLFWSPWTMVLTALTLRLVVMGFSYPSLLDPARDHYAFGYEFGRVARSIATGHGFSSPYPEPTGPTALIGPVYPYLLAGVFKLFGVYTTASALLILTLNNLFSSFTCLPIVLIARRVFGPAAAAWAGWSWAFFPYSLAGSNGWVWETILTTLLLTLLILYTLHLEHSVSCFAWIGYGLLWSLTALTSAATLSTLPFLGIWILVRQWRNNRNPVGQVVAASLVFLVTVAPWVSRCSQLYGRFVAFRGNFGLEVMVGNSNDTSHPSNWNMLPGENRAELEKLKSGGEPAYMAEKLREARQVIASHPVRYAGQTLRRMVYSWTELWNFPPPWNLDGSGVPDILTYSFISLLAFIGLGRAIRSCWQDAMPLMIPLIFFPVVYYLTHQDVRFRHPIDPMVVIFAAYGALAFRRQTPASPGEGRTLGSVPEESLSA